MSFGSRGHIFFLKRIDKRIYVRHTRDMTTTRTQARINFDSMIETRTLDQAISALTINDESTVEGMMIRVALINHIEKISPAIKAWVSDFYDVDEDDERWDVDYRDAILLAREAVAA